MGSWQCCYPLTRGSQLPPDRHSTHVLGTIPPDNQRYPQPAQLLSNIYGNTFVLHWRFLGFDLDCPLFLSNMFCQIPSEISFIHSSSVTQQAPSSLAMVTDSRSFSVPSPPFPHVPVSPSPTVAPALQVSLWIPGRLNSCLSAP